MDAGEIKKEVNKDWRDHPEETVQRKASFFCRTTYKPQFLGKTILIALAVAALVSISVFLSYYTIGDDFSVYYRVGGVINNAKVHNEVIYDDRFMAYSIPVAYLFGSLALLPYHTAKAIFIFTNCAMYLTAIGLILRFNKTTGRWFVYPLAFSCLWPPFLQDIRLANVDCILLFLVTLSALSAEKDRPALSGFLLAIATLFKVFPIAIAMVMGLKNWRIFAVCALTVGASFFIPGSLKWLSAIGLWARWEVGLTLPYLFLNQINIVYFIFYAITIAGTTAWLCHRLRSEANYFLFVAFAIPAVFLVMTILEYQHLTLLAFSLVFLLTSSHKTSRLLLAGIILSVAMISSFFVLVINHKILCPNAYQRALISLGLFPLWFALVIMKWPFLRKAPALPG